MPTTSILLDGPLALLCSCQIGSTWVGLLHALSTPNPGSTRISARMTVFEEWGMLIWVRTYEVDAKMGPRWSPRGGDPRTPSGPEGSSGNGDAGRRGVAGADSLANGRKKIERNELPRTCKEMATEDVRRCRRPAHIVRALANALSSGRVHHAFLFRRDSRRRQDHDCPNSGQGPELRGGRLGRALRPMSACIGVDEGRFVDLDRGRCRVPHRGR